MFLKYMERNKQPTKEFVYPKGEHMCQAGKVRATGWSQKILTGQMQVEELEKMAEQADRAERQGADINKKKLIAKIVVVHAKRGDLNDYTNENGDFVSGGILHNIYHSKFAHLVRQLFGGGE